MLDFLIPFKTFIKYGGIINDNIIFRLHYKLTVVLLLIFTLILSSRQFFGNPIECMDNGNAGNSESVNTYCWTYGTFTLASAMNKDNVDYDGVGISYGVRPYRADDHEVRHTYYQWVGFILLIQAIMFYIPRYLWKVWEGGRLCSLTTNLSGPIIPKEWSEYRRDQIVSYFNYTSTYTHNVYALKYCFCELLNLVNVIGQIFLLDSFLGGTFRDYGTAISTFTRLNKLEKRGGQIFYTTSPVDKYFPKLTKCTINMYGATGSQTPQDKLCVLPLNLVNEKIFAALWFWFIILSTVSAIAVLVRVLIINMPKFQSLMLLGQLKIPYNRLALEDLVKRHGFGGWFVLNLLGKNMNPIIYKDLINELVKENKLIKGALQNEDDEFKKPYDV